MNNQVSDMFIKLKEYFLSLSKKAKTVLLVSLVVLVVVAYALTTWLNKTNYEVLFTGLTQQELVEISGRLQSDSVTYLIEGTSILVPRENEHVVRASLVSEGYPKNGFSYGVFTDNVGMMSTDFEKNKFELYELQDRIASTIRIFSGVQDAVVTIALAENNRYVLESEKQEATAAVTVIMQNNREVTSELASTIQHLVSTSVLGVDFSNVTVADGKGIVVSSSNSSSVGATQDKMNIELEIENSIKSKIMEILQPIYGRENIRVSVKSNVDIDKRISEITSYAGNDDNRGVVNNEDTAQEVVRNDGVNPAGVPGTEVNADFPVYEGAVVDGEEVYFNDQRSYEYLVNQIKEQIQSEAGTITDVTVSAVINSEPLDEVEMDSIRRLIGNTAGIDPTLLVDKVAVVGMLFEVQPEVVVLEESWISANALFLAIALGVLLLAIIVATIAMIITSKKRKKKAVMQAEIDRIAEEENRARELEELAAIDLTEVPMTREMEIKEKIQQFVAEYPEIAAKLLRTWMRGGDTSD